jgi:hypothetical protein
MSNAAFPRTQIEGVSLSRMIIGTNWILGWSHTGAAADAVIRQTNYGKEPVADILEAFLENGVDAIMGPLSVQPLILDSMKLAEDRTGKRLIRIDTPIINVDDNAAARREAEETIADCKRQGAMFCLPHHSSAEQLVCKNTRTIDRLPDYLKMVRDHGMIPGLSAHMPELIIYSDLNEYDVQTYIQIYNCLGFLMQIEIESVRSAIWNAKKPVMTIKPMAAGRCTPFVGLNFVWNTLRPQDMVTVGCMTPREAVEDIEISLAALERRPPDVEGRASPKKTEIMK